VYYYGETTLAHLVGLSNVDFRTVGLPPIPLPYLLFTNVAGTTKLAGTVKFPFFILSNCWYLALCFMCCVKEHNALRPLNLSGQFVHDVSFILLLLHTNMIVNSV
jgi:hypothetical protein